VDDYVTMIELPIRWHQLIPAHQKDSLMNALLARYGGVALDISTILLRPLDDVWNNMVGLGASFWGYMYRINGQPWRHAESTSVYFLMSRREGVFSTAVRNQVIGMGDRNETGAYHHWYLALGDQTLTPILHMFNYSLPKCIHDTTVLRKWECPENEQKWDEQVTGPARNDTCILLRDPRDGPQLPFAFEENMPMWNTSDDATPVPLSDNAIGSSMYMAHCVTMKRCWEDVFLSRYLEPAVDGQAHVLPFVKMFRHGADLDGKSRQDLLSAKDTFFYNWLKLSGLPNLSR